jgi:hypothetical protein
MILKNPNSKLSIVNLLSDFILSKFPQEEHTIIQVTDCSNFYVINGKTSYDEIINLNEVLTEFTNKFSDFTINRKLTHTIDLIRYNVEMEEKKELTHTYHNTINCSYYYEQIDSYTKDKSYSYDYSFNLRKISDDDFMSVTSEFPHGYSLSQGRMLYYYGKHIFYNIPTNYPVNTLTLTISKNPEDFKVYDNYSNSPDETLESAILDVFDFNMKELESEIKKVDWFIEITNPLEEHSCLKEVIKDFIIL